MVWGCLRLADGDHRESCLQQQRELRERSQQAGAAQWRLGGQAEEGTELACLS